MAWLKEWGENIAIIVGIGFLSVGTGVLIVAFYLALMAIPIGLLAVAIWWLFGPALGIR